jgi:hypothetical protein
MEIEEGMSTILRYFRNLLEEEKENNFLKSEKQKKVAEIIIQTEKFNEFL